jgi:alpha-tubulin suppressor-like RCC1 family protein
MLPIRQHASAAALIVVLASCGSRTPLLVDGVATTTSSANGTATDAGTIGTRARTLSASWQHTCAITSDGSVMCWGQDFISGASNPTPTKIAGLEDVVEIGAGQSIDCARRKDGAILCWGAATSGKLVTMSSPPVTAMSVGPYGMCGVDGLGNATCNGTAFLSCMFGTPSFDASAMAVAGLVNSKGIAIGQRHACAFEESGATLCWGCGDDNGIAEDAFSLGSRSPSTSMPIPVPGVSSTIAISADTESTCAVQSDGSILCWGDASQFAPGIVLQPTGPVKADLPPSPIDLDVGLTFTCAAYPNEVRCVGGEPTFADGCSTRSDTPQTFSVPNITEIAVGFQHACARDAQGSVWCWGCNRNSEIGNGSNQPSATPLKVL